MVTILNRQTLFDIAIQEYGNVQAVFDLALHNDLSVTSVLMVGTKLNIENSDFLDTDIIQFYRNKNIKPATYTVDIKEEIAGIGKMKIGSLTSPFKIT